MPSLTTIVASGLLAAGSLSAQMVGTYSVNPTWPAFPGNFTSLAAATAALASQGVIGPVTIEVYDDAGPYTESSPFVTANVQWAPSDAVLVFGQWTGVSTTNRVTFRAAPGEAPVLDAAGRAMGVFWNGADYVTLQGFEIRNALFDAVTLYSEASHGVATDPIIDRCRIHDCPGSGVTVYGNSSYPLNTVISNNVFYRLQTANTGGFNTTARFGYITTRRSTNTRIVHNTFLVDSGAGSLMCVFGSNCSGATEQPFAEISNNIVFKTAAAGSPIFNLRTLAGATQLVPAVCDSNCFFDVTTSPFGIYGAAGASTAQALIDWQVNTLADLTSQYADPQFLDLTARNLHLQPSSPCNGASTVAAGVSVDMDGQPRVAPGTDVGADEISAATVAVVGAGCIGSNSRAPVLSTNTWPFLGNQEFALHGNDLPPSQPMFVFASFGVAASPFPIGAGCAVSLNLGSLVALSTFGVASPAGNANIVLPLPNNAAYVGVNLAYQAMTIDPGAQLGLTLSNALDVVLGF